MAAHRRSPSSQRLAGTEAFPRAILTGSGGGGHARRTGGGGRACRAEVGEGGCARCAEGGRACRAGAGEGGRALGAGGRGRAPPPCWRRGWPFPRPRCRSSGPSPLLRRVRREVRERRKREAGEGEKKGHEGERPDADAWWRRQGWCARRRRQAWRRRRAACRWWAWTAAGRKAGGIWLLEKASFGWGDLSTMPDLYYEMGSAFALFLLETVLGLPNHTSSACVNF